MQIQVGKFNEISFLFHNHYKKLIQRLITHVWSFNSSLLDDQSLIFTRNRAHILIKQWENKLESVFISDKWSDESESLFEALDEEIFFFFWIPTTTIITYQNHHQTLLQSNYILTKVSIYTFSMTFILSRWFKWRSCCHIQWSHWRCWLFGFDTTIGWITCRCVVFLIIKKFFRLKSINFFCNICRCRLINFLIIYLVLIWIYSGFFLKKKVIKTRTGHSEDFNEI